MLTVWSKTPRLGKSDAGGCNEMGTESLASEQLSRWDLADEMWKMAYESQQSCFQKNPFWRDHEMYEIDSWPCLTGRYRKHLVASQPREHPFWDFVPSVDRSQRCVRPTQRQQQRCKKRVKENKTFASWVKMKVPKKRYSNMFPIGLHISTVVVCLYPPGN